jgi:hypothetical protein
MRPFDLTAFFFLLSSDEGDLHDDDVSSDAWALSLINIRDWLLRPN